MTAAMQQGEKLHAVHLAVLATCRMLGFLIVIIALDIVGSQLHALDLQELHRTSLTCMAPQPLCFSKLG